MKKPKYIYINVGINSLENFCMSTDKPTEADLEDDDSVIIRLKDNHIWWNEEWVPIAESEMYEFGDGEVVHVSKSE